VVDVCRDAGTRQGTFYQWKAKYSGMDSSQLKKLKDLEAEVLRYQRLVGQQALQITVLKDVIEKKL
jgi:putative transposase